MSSLVSVIIPVYNCPSLVVEAIQSVLDQDYLNREVIVVNDGSTDNTLEVLKGFGDAIRVVDQENGGPPRARNNGLKAAQGDYIAFLDADDIWAQGKLAAQVAHLDSNPEVGTVLTNWHVWPANEDGRFARPDFFSEPMLDARIDEAHSGWLYNRLLFDCELLTTTVMMRASLIKAVGNFDVTLFNGDDYDYWIRASRVAKISRLSGVGALYRIVPGSVSRKPRETNFELEVIRKAVARWGLLGPDGTETDKAAFDKRLQRLIFNHAYDHLNRGDPQIAYRGFQEALRLKPFDVKLWLFLARAFGKKHAQKVSGRTFSG